MDRRSSLPAKSEPNPEMDKKNLTYPLSKREEKVVGTKSSVFNMPKNTRTPNVFKTAPRPGGYLRTLVSSNGDDQAHINTALSINYTPPPPTDHDRLLGAFKTLAEREASNAEAEGEGRNLTTSAHQRSSRFSTPIDGEQRTTPQGNDTNYVLSIVISTLMALAANPNAEIPKHHLSWTMNFLITIKDDNNRTPTNTAGIKKQIIRPLVLNASADFMFMEADYIDEDDYLNVSDLTTPAASEISDQDGNKSNRISSDGARGKGPVTSTPSPPKSLNKSKQKTSSKTSVEMSGSRSPRRSSWK